MIGFLHFAVLHGELYVLAPRMPDWVNGLYFLSLAEIQEVRASHRAPFASDPALCEDRSQSFACCRSCSLPHHV